MNHLTKRNALIVAISCLLILLTLSGCGFEREYNDDIIIQLEDRDGEIVIKEWSFLMGSGAEVYYRNGKNDMKLGSLLGGDDGFCPFKEGLYTVTVSGNEVTIEWDRLPADSTIPWEKKTFELPSE